MKKHKVQWLLLFLFDQFGFIDVKILQPFERMGFPWLRRSKQQITRLKPAAVVIRKAPLLIMPYFLLVEKKHANNQQTIKSRTVKCRSLEGGRPIKKKKHQENGCTGKVKEGKKTWRYPCLFFLLFFSTPSVGRDKRTNGRTLGGQSRQQWKSQIKVTEVESWRWRRSATRSACHVQLTFLSGAPVVSSVDGILCPRRRLSPGTPTNRKIFHCVSISNGERGEEGVRTEGGRWRRGKKR